MKTKLSWILALSAALLCGSAFSQADEPTAGADLEREVTRLQAEVTRLRRDLDATARLVEQTVVYLERQAKSGKELAKALAASEEAGFTYGINPRSREILLAAFRSEVEARQQGLPGAPPPEEEPANGRRRP